jgi:hypothetical protein
MIELRWLQINLSSHANYSQSAIPIGGSDIFLPKYIVLQYRQQIDDYWRDWQNVVVRFENDV